MAKGRRDNRKKKDDKPNSGLIERTVKIKRCAAVVKGGRRFSFAAMVVCGDGKGKVGWGYGKANEVQPSVEKANKQASRSLKPIDMVDGSSRTASMDASVPPKLSCFPPVLVPELSPAQPCVQSAKPQA